MTTVQQKPAPGAHLVTFQGEFMTFVLNTGAESIGSAWLRTNIGYAHVRNREIINHVEMDEPILSRDWHDIEMHPDGIGRYVVSLPLTQVGRFEAKALFIQEGVDEPIWPAGDNVVIKVEPADYVCANSIYSTFVRQFGPNKSSRAEEWKQQIEELEKNGYAVIPPSGTFRDVIKELDHIMGKLRFRILQLLPIHPIPTTYARMGRFGSPFAVLDFMDVDPALAEFDKRTTPLEQFGELVDAVHKRLGKLFIDIPINHTGWASRLQIEHPEWFARDKDSAFESPGAWGVTWEDLARLDYRHKALWTHMANVFLFWCSQGVDGFRCDAGYMIPVQVWEYIVAKVRMRYPNTIFMLEGLGGDLNVVRSLLDNANMDWAYSELFQNYTRQQIEGYLPYATNTSHQHGLLIDFAETHDNNRLASVSEIYARMRVCLCALASRAGGFGMVNGVEWFAAEKIDVHDASSLNWGAQRNQINLISRLNALLAIHPCFHADATIELVRHSGDHTVALIRKSSDEKKRVLILVNLDCQAPCELSWAKTDFAGFDKSIDLITGSNVRITGDGDRLSCHLEAGQAFCLAPEKKSVQELESAIVTAPSEPVKITTQNRMTRAMALAERNYVTDYVRNMSSSDVAEVMRKDETIFAAEASGMEPAPIINWRWPEDANRVVMIPAGHWLRVCAQNSFEVSLRVGGQNRFRVRSLQNAETEHTALLPYTRNGDTSENCSLGLTVYAPTGPKHANAPLLFLSSGQKLTVKTALTRQEVIKSNAYVICTNRIGAMAQIRGAWGEVSSQYDALLAANLNPDHPSDRRVMFTRCRAWIVFQGYSTDVRIECLRRFARCSADIAWWDFSIPLGRGMTIPLRIEFGLAKESNTVELAFSRGVTTDTEKELNNDTSVKLIIRPDIEDRTSHEKTKAYTGPENTWPGVVRQGGDGFEFSPSKKHRLNMALSGSAFIAEPEWSYMVSHPIEAARGLDGSSDLFSPGYFVSYLKGGDSVVLKAGVTLSSHETQSAVFSRNHEKPQPVDDGLPLEKALKDAMRQFIVKRGNGETIIAGYPWFLDWGRDSLIALRGLIAAGMLDDSADIVKQFARFEQNGTLPNVLRENDHINRDTSDAPLWLFVAVNDLESAGCSVLGVDCGGRTVADVLISIAHRYMAGTPNGIVMDKDSGLIFSPSHFTWMDTNYPAGTPREGYPIEIQALWHAALQFLSKIDGSGKWQKHADRVRESIMMLFRRNSGFFSDCLHAEPGQSASEAHADDHLRPNQLLAVTLGAVDDKSAGSEIVSSCGELLIPGGIRSLANRAVDYKLPIKREGRLLNDPARPYWGHYEGDEDTRRKPAYHNGTAWTWLFPSYSESLLKIYGNTAKKTALSLLGSCLEVINRGCFCQVPELLDGDMPHCERGCGAQAWGVTELYRVLAILTTKS
ncbi:MAG: glycogen debranching enzyme N-terminal domain-containing protein [Lentisphaerae bacterium]|nr:glycogen debranching enzyme N-terminal domain-containing protein [Lentisphaerota bacterium]